MTASQDYLLVDAEPGGLLLDTRPGTIFSLNGSAAQIWRWRLDGIEPAAIARNVSERFGLPLEVAVRDVEAALQLPTTPTMPRPPSDFFYERSDDRRYVFHFQGAAIFELDDRGSQLLAVSSTLPRPLPFLLQAVIPKVLSLRGHLVLHASAVELGGEAFAFTGVSGAGKTTTARGLMRHGARVLCEDKLFVRVTPEGAVEAPLGADAVMKRWIFETTAILTRGAAAPCELLDAAALGPGLRLREVGLVDASRRRGTSVAACRLPRHDAAAALFRQMFWGSDVVSQWSRQLSCSVALASSVAVYELDLPDGLTALDRALADVAARRTFAPG